MSKRKITIVDIANALGISKATVSRALNGLSVVNPKTKKKILDFAKKNHYFPNLHARSLAQKNSKIIGCIFPDTRDLYFQHQPQIAKEFEKYGYTVIFYFCNNNEEEQEKYVYLLEMQKVDGFLICPVRGSSEKVKNLLDISKEKYVFLNRHIREDVFNKALIDFEQSHYDLLICLLAKNKKNICLIRHEEARYPNDRSSVVIELKEKHQLDINLEFIDVNADNIQRGYYEVKKILEAKKKIDAFLCPSDSFGLGAIRACKDIGIEVPRDVSIIGCYSEVNLSYYTIPRLSTIRYNSADMVSRSTKRLINLIKDEEYKKETIIVGSEFIDQETT